MTTFTTFTTFTNNKTSREVTAYIRDNGTVGYWNLVNGERTGRVFTKSAEKFAAEFTAK